MKTAERRAAWESIINKAYAVIGQSQRILHGVPTQPESFLLVSRDVRDLADAIEELRGEYLPKAQCAEGRDPSNDDCPRRPHECVEYCYDCDAYRGPNKA